MTALLTAGVLALFLIYALVERMLPNPFEPEDEETS